MELKDSQFQLKILLIYNPKLIPDKKKPIEEEIQQAKIIYYYPLSIEIQQKRNHVGLAEGMYSFFDFLVREQSSTKHQIIYTNNQVFIIKQFEPDIWFFMGLTKLTSYTYSKQLEQYYDKSIHTYSYETFNQEICVNILDHFYNTFRVFYGKVMNLVALKERIPQFTRTMTEFIGRYILLNQNNITKKFDLNYYLFTGLRLTPLDANYVLKFNYFNSILETLDPISKETIIFYNGYLVFSSLPPEITLFFFNYYYSLGQPFKFDQTKIKKKFTNLDKFKDLGKSKYGYFINSMNYGYDSKKQKKVEKQKAEDLLGLVEQNVIDLIEVFLTIKKQQVSYRMNTFIEGKLLFITFSNGPKPIEKIYFQNRFFHDNVHRFNQKINSVLTPIYSQPQFYKFVYLNMINMVGKLTFSIDEFTNIPLRNILTKLRQGNQNISLTISGPYWVYGYRRINRLLVVVLPNDIPVHRIEDYLQRLHKQTFSSIYI